MSAIVRRIGHMDAVVSILTLQTEMFVSFGQGMRESVMKMMNGIKGAAVCLIVLFMGIQGVYHFRHEKRAGV